VINIIVGRSASGKDTVADKMSKIPGNERIIGYTTRNKRDNEANGKEYHFISVKEFKEKVKEGFFLEYKEYTDDTYGTVYYGSTKEYIFNLLEAISFIEDINLFNIADKEKEILIDISNVKKAYKKYIQLGKIKKGDYDIDKIIDTLSMNYIIILEPNGVYDLYDYINIFENNTTKMGFKINELLKSFIKITYIEADKEKRRKRYISRGQSIEDFEIREALDNDKFNKFEEKHLYHYLIRNQ